MKKSRYVFNVVVCLIVISFILPVNLQAVTYTYDALNRLQEVQYDSGEKVRHKYDLEGNLVERVLTYPELQNGSFEQQESMQGGADKWSFQLSDASGQAFLTSSTAQSGQYSQVILATNMSSEGYAAISQAIEVGEHEFYGLEAGVNVASLVDAQVELIVDFYNSEIEKIHSTSIDYQEETNDFITLSLTDEIPAHTSFLQVQARIQSLGSNGSGIMFVDDVSLVWEELDLIPPIDMTPPEIVNVSPEPNSVTVDVYQSIAVTFNEPIQEGIHFNDISIRAGTTVTTATYSITGNTLMIVPHVNLSYDTTYTLEIPAGAIQDEAFNSLAFTYTMSFTTESQVEILDPDISAYHVPMNEVVMASQRQSMWERFQRFIMQSFNERSMSLEMIYRGSSE